MKFKDPVRGSLRGLDKPGEKLIFQYNPNEVNVVSAANWTKQKVAGLHHARLQYAGGDGRVVTFTLQLWNEDQEGKSVEERSLWLQSLTYPDIQGDSVQNRAPLRMILTMGQLFKGLPCVVENVSVNYSKVFAADMTPKYAEIDLTLIEDRIKAQGYLDVRK